MAFRDLSFDSDIDTKEIAKFLENSNNVTTDSYTLVPPNRLEEMKNWPSEWVLLRQDQKLIALLVSFEFTCVLDDRIEKVGHTAFLAVKPKYRKKGFAKRCIQEVKRRAGLREIYTEYHISDRMIGSNAIPITAWLRPLNVEECHHLGMTLPLKEYPIVKADEWGFRKSNSDDTGIQKLLQKYPVRLKEWNFPGCNIRTILYRFKRTDLAGATPAAEGCELYQYDPVAYISYHFVSVYFKANQQTYEIPLVDWFFGSAIALTFALSQFGQVPFVYFHQMGPLTEKLLQSVSASPVSKRYLNWYNWSRHWTADKICLPLY